MLSEPVTTVLLVLLILAAVAVIAWAWRTRGQDGPYRNEFVSSTRTERKGG